MEKNDLTAAENYLEKSLAVYAKLDTLFASSEAAMVKNNLACLLRRQKNYSSAESLLSEAEENLLNQLKFREEEAANLELARIYCNQIYLYSTMS